MRYVTLLLFLATCCNAAAHADEGVLQKIRQTGTITAGHREASIPFSYYDDRRQVVGYSIAILKKVVAALQKQLGLSQVGIKFVPVTTENRIPMIRNGSIDIECGSTSNTAERQRLVDFSNSIFVIGTRILTKRSSRIEEIDDLARKTVVVTANTNAEKALRDRNRERVMGMNIVVAKDHDEAFATVESGRADAFFMDDALLFGMKAQARDPMEWKVVGLPLTREAYACILPKGDAAFKKIVDAEIARIMLSGEGETLFSAWFRTPIPPNGINFDIPLTPETKAWMQKPNDVALDTLLPSRRPTSMTDNNCFRGGVSDPSCASALGSPR